MKLLYLDCFSGISGDMFLGALLDLGIDERDFISELRKLPLSGYEIEIRKASKKGIMGTDVYIKSSEHHPHRGLKEIYEIIDKSALNPEVKKKSKEAFFKLAAAEGKIHGKAPEEIHFHEVGAVDSIVDIVGACLLMDIIKPDKVVASPVNVGHGTVRCAHGLMPVPAPATLELLKGVPVYSRGEEGELTTPTGALLLSVFASDFGPMPQGIPEKIGYGLGKKERESPNVLRAVLLKNEDEDPEKDRVLVMEANIDDMNPQLYEAVIESLMQKGALDVFLTPIIMKKSRPAVKLSCIAPLDKRKELADAILKETTTIGVRFYEVERMKLERSIELVNTPWGQVRVKVLKKGGKVERITPEFEDVKRLSQNSKIPALQAYRDILGFLSKNDE
ncbi:MAG: nickel pincer cofactor biosynthesis protein LarC [Thermosediminibacteraceae bacterium]|nr:nickel pincer cofactor biosynthesis protein LarC [Thermosediminibacteraceae bacterium]